jgi:hypothetical protein
MQNNSVATDSNPLFSPVCAPSLPPLFPEEAQLNISLFKNWHLFWENLLILNSQANPFFHSLLFVIRWRKKHE